MASKFGSNQNQSLEQLFEIYTKEECQRIRDEKYQKNKSEKEQKDELLIHGFSRNIQKNVLSSDVIIPSAINNILLQFYHIPLTEPDKVMPGPLRRIVKELHIMMEDAPPNISAGLGDNDIFSWIARIVGPTDTPYEGGVFWLKMDFRMEYPFVPPKVIFTTKVYHCNINDRGKISLDILEDRWGPAMTVDKTLLSISSLLSEPNPDDPLVPSIAKLYKTNRKEHDRICREWTEKYAK